MLELYQHLIHLRRTMPALKTLDKQNLEASAVEDDKLLFLRRESNGEQIFCIMNFNDKDVTFKASSRDSWRKILDSSDDKWMGSGSTMPEKLVHEQEATIRPQSFALYQLETLAQ
jgi:maltooligosyltrehalose trehalohydrolase